MLYHHTRQLHRLPSIQPHLWQKFLAKLPLTCLPPQRLSLVNLVVVVVWLGGNQVVRALVKVMRQRQKGIAQGSHTHTPAHLSMITRMSTRA